MKKSFYNKYIVLVFSILSFLVFIIGCIPIEDPIKFPQGTFPNSVINLTDINSEYDDYNISLPTLFGNSQIIFSSNRRSTGGQFDLEQANIYFEFDKTNGYFSLITEMTDDAFLDRLISKAKTPGNDFGPYRLYSTLDEFEYLLLSSENSAGNLDLFYLKNRPAYNSGLPEVDGPYPIKLFNTNSDDAYICFDSDLDSAFFVTNKDGNFDIFLQKRPADKSIASWFNLDYANSTKVDILNSSSEDKCPMVFQKIMVFTSNRPGGLGGYDLYYSIFKNGNWSSPVNLGPEINTSSDEYRPVLGYHPDFTNFFMMFSSNRTGGKGGFDLYFSGVEFPEK